MNLFLEKAEKVEHRVDNIEIKLDKCLIELQNKATKIEVDNISSQLQRFALYEDYK